MNRRGPSLDSVESDAISRASSTGSAGGYQEQPLQPVVSVSATLRLQPATSNSLSRDDNSNVPNQQSQQPQQPTAANSNSNNNNSSRISSGTSRLHLQPLRSSVLPQQQQSQPPPHANSHHGESFVRRGTSQNNSRSATPDNQNQLQQQQHVQTGNRFVVRTGNLDQLPTMSTTTTAATSSSPDQSTNNKNDRQQQHELAELSPLSDGRNNNNYNKNNNHNNNSNNNNSNAKQRRPPVAQQLLSSSAPSAAVEVYPASDFKKVRQLEQENEDLVQRHHDEMHKMNLDLASAKMAVDEATKTNEAMELRLRAALESEHEVMKKNDKLRQHLDELSTRAKTKDGDFASWDDKKNTLFVNNIKGRFEITVYFFESLLDLVLYDKKLTQQESLCYRRTQEKMEQLLNESEQLRDEMQTTAALADETHLRNLDVAQRTIDELHREIISLSKRTGSMTSSTNYHYSCGDNGLGGIVVVVGGGGEPASGMVSRGVTPSPTTNNFISHNNNNNNNNNSNMNQIRGASSTHLRSATAPIDQESTSRKMKEELSDALQAKESLSQTNRQLRRKVEELESEMRNLYDESKRVHEMLRRDAQQTKTDAFRATNDEIARVKQESQSINCGLINRVGNLEAIVEERTHALILAQQQVKHLTELLEDACKVGGVPILRTAANPGSPYPKLTLQQSASGTTNAMIGRVGGSVAPAWANASPSSNHNGSGCTPTKESSHRISSGAGPKASNRVVSRSLLPSPSSPSSSSSSSAKKKKAQNASENDAVVNENMNKGWVAGSLAASASTSSALGARRHSATSPVQPTWNNSRKTSVPLPTASQFTPPPKAKKGFGLFHNDHHHHHQDPVSVAIPNNNNNNDDVESDNLQQQTMPNARGYTAGMLPSEFFPAWVQQRTFSSSTSVQEDFSHQHNRNSNHDHQYYDDVDVGGDEIIDGNNPTAYYNENYDYY